MQWKCAVCGIRKSRFVKEQELKGLLSNLGIKILLSKIPLLNVLFWMQLYWMQFHWVYKKEQNCEQIFAVKWFMPEMYLKQSGVTYSACGPFTRKKEKFMQT